MPTFPPPSLGVEINRIKRGYVETQSRRASSSKLRGLNSELQGVQKIMFENIDAALQRGELVTSEIGLMPLLCTKPLHKSHYKRSFSS